MRFVIVNSNKDTISSFQSEIDELQRSVPQLNARLQCFNGGLKEYVATLSKKTETTESSKAAEIPETSKSIKNTRVAVVSPANSLCFMGGGFDYAIAELFTSSGQDYRRFEAITQKHTLDKFNGFVPPQSTNIIDLLKLFDELNEDFPFHNITHLVQTPTMAVPEKISPVTIFYCMWNTLLAVDKKLDIVIFPVMGAGYGGVPSSIVAKTMCGALGLYFMDFKSPLSRGAAVLLFLNKNYKALENTHDIAHIESVLTSEGKKILEDYYDNRNSDSFNENGSLPLNWSVLIKCLRVA